VLKCISFFSLAFSVVCVNHTKIKWWHRKLQRKFSEEVLPIATHICQIPSEAEFEDDNKFDLFQISSASRDKIEMKVEINGKEISMEFDSGAGSSIIPHSMYKEFFSDCVLLPTDIVLRSYFRETKRPLGRMLCSLSFQGRKAENMTLYVANQDDVDPVIGKPWLRALGIIDKQNNVHLDLKQVAVNPLRRNLRQLLKKYFSLFDGQIGDAKNFVCSHQLGTRK
jgi:hypothetical protein